MSFLNFRFKFHPTVFILFVTIIIFACSFFQLKKEPTVFENQLDFSLSNLDGDIITSTDKLFENKIIFITLWGTWCPPCLTEIPTFNNLQLKYNTDEFIIIGIAFERIENSEKRQEKLIKFANKHEIKYMILDGGFIADFDKTFSSIVDVKGFPVEIIINRSGKVIDIRNGYGFSEEWAIDLEDRIKNALAKK